MGTRATLLLLLIVLCYRLTSVAADEEQHGHHRHYHHHHHHHGEKGDEDWRRENERGEEEREVEQGSSRDGIFLMQDSHRVVHTDAGEMRVMRSYQGTTVERPVHIGFITMEPRSLFIPQYTDSSLILFIREGEAQLGTIYRSDLVERSLSRGDLYRISAGSAFYLVNAHEAQGLHVVCSIDPSESLGAGNFQSFFIGGGSDPASVLEGFGPRTLAAAFNVSTAEVEEILSREREGPIVHMSQSHRRSPWSDFLNLKVQDKLRHLQRAVELRGAPSPVLEEDVEDDEEVVEEEEEDEDERIEWSWRKLLDTVFGRHRRGRRHHWGHHHEAPDSCNLYDRSPSFRNNYGWSVALDESDYRPLRRSGIGIYLVNLTAGSMMAPHVNPSATEYGIVLSGSGTIQIGYPNGSAAMDTRVKEGDVFWVPRYYPFCQISSRTEPLEFFGFTTSAHRNRPQFLVGRNSVLHTMGGSELATSFGTSRQRMKRLLNAQRESVILPSPEASPAMEEREMSKRKEGLDGDLIMDI